ncbi:MAG TPA: formylglycine-generating enzyme family protein [Patescibacteria group bacterium]|nr:formylglycine-generating enzyme family protein [Patescibacteria group bacterium]
MKKIKSILLAALLLFVATTVQAQDLGISWIEVKGGTFTMGSGSSARRVTVGGFHMSATEVTFDQFAAYCRATGAEMPDDNGWGMGSRPVLKVSYDDALGFCRWLSKKSGSKIRLPNEAEWEYAAIGGNASQGTMYSGSNDWDEVSWSEGNSAGRTHPVGGKKANELGLYDMSGNLWEWCADWPAGGKNDSRSGQKRCLRGNSFDNPASSVRHPALRIGGDARHYNIGFRVVKN